MCHPRLPQAPDQHRYPRDPTTSLKWHESGQKRTGLGIKTIVRRLRPLRSATIAINGATQTFPPTIDPDRQVILEAITHVPLTH